MVKDKNLAEEYKELVKKIANLNYLEENREYVLGNVLIFKRSEATCERSEQGIVEDRFISEEPMIENEKTIKIYENALPILENLKSLILDV